MQKRQPTFLLNGSLLKAGLHSMASDFYRLVAEMLDVLDPFYRAMHGVMVRAIVLETRFQSLDQNHRIS